MTLEAATIVGRWRDAHERSHCETAPAGGADRVRSCSYLLTTVPGLQTSVSTGPVFAIFPIHGGRDVESRPTVDGMNISNPPGGNQPPNYTANIGNAAEVTIEGCVGKASTGHSPFAFEPQ